MAPRKHKSFEFEFDIAVTENPRLTSRGLYEAHAVVWKRVDGVREAPAIEVGTFFGATYKEVHDQARLALDDWKAERQTASTKNSAENDERSGVGEPWRRRS